MKYCRESTEGFQHGAWDGIKLCPKCEALKAHIRGEQAKCGHSVKIRVTLNMNRCVWCYKLIPINQKMKTFKISLQPSKEPFIVKVKKVLRFNDVILVIHRGTTCLPLSGERVEQKKDWKVSEYSTGLSLGFPEQPTIKLAEEITMRRLLAMDFGILKSAIARSPIINH